MSREIIQLIDERDRAEEWADRLADAIAAFFGVELGEHEGGYPGNCPWQNALKLIEGQRHQSAENGSGRSLG